MLNELLEMYADNRCWGWWTIHQITIQSKIVVVTMRNDDDHTIIEFAYHLHDPVGRLLNDDCIARLVADGESDPNREYDD